MNNADARILFKESGLTYNDVFDNIIILKEHIKSKLNDFANLGKMKMELSNDWLYRFIKDTRNIECFFLFINGPYFKDREAISFNSDGFIGFAGWASSENTQPILDAFEAFISEISIRKEALDD